MTKLGIEEAKRLLSAAGYACIPAEHLHKLSASTFVSAPDMVSLGSDPKFMDDVLKRSHMQMGVALSRHSSLRVESDDMHFGRRFTVSCTVVAKCIQGVDPWEQMAVERMREFQD